MLKGGKAVTSIKKGENKFFVGEDEQNPAAEITFELSEEDHLVVDHTFVSDELRGQGMAGKLVERVVNHARDERKKIVPVCSYAKEKMEKTSEYQDVLAD
ncbi:GNAT family N-acetyltransferase [Virgibacillus sp. C22-A2]|uniref:GNAT family N-acetyltransferase n=1 Tax=Virgibacillus tibetensis TaxID=3042313 RepID=A0ABU6KFX0_9BACI|nr:GNAT family N-acetyltransferase [Virgibacillus sp. C22-A2]